MDTTDRNITMADIADELGVSLTTVSRALSGNGRVGGATRDRIIEYAQSVGFKPNVVAVSLAKQRTGNIALVVPSGSNLSELPYFQNSMQGVCTAALNNEYDVIIAMREGMDYSILGRLIDNHKIDGVILSRSIAKDQAISYLKGQGIPFVIMGSSSDKEVAQVDNDHSGGCASLTRSFLANGTKRIGIIGGNSNYVVNQSRLAGFKDAFKLEGAAVDEGLIYMDCNSQDKVEIATRRLIEQNAQLIIGMDDVTCSYVLEALKDEGISIPGQIQVASFYDSSLLHRWETGITALAFDDKLLGEAAFKTLYTNITGKAKAEQVLLGYKIADRGSTLSA